MALKVSFTNSRGEEIILDADDLSFAREIVGRSGTSAPSVSLKEIEYANGEAETVSVTQKSRDIDLMFYAMNMREPQNIDAYKRMEMRLIETGRKNAWGKLKIRCSDGRYLVSECVYSGGLNGIASDNDDFLAFSLSFHASDPLFYEENDREHEVGADAGTSIMMHTGLMMGPNIRMGGRAMKSHTSIVIDAQRAWPTIKVDGPATAIRFINSMTGKTIELDPEYSIIKGEKVIITTQPLYRKIEKVSTTGLKTVITNRMEPRSTLNWPLERGVNAITLRATDADNDTGCVFSYKQGWLSVW